MEKRQKRDQELGGGEGCVSSNDDDSREMRGGRKERDETIERFSLISALLSILGHCVL